MVKMLQKKYRVSKRDEDETKRPAKERPAGRTGSESF